MNRIIFVLLFSIVIFSCNTRKIGFFNNHNERYQQPSAAVSSNKNIIASNVMEVPQKVFDHASNKVAAVSTKLKENIKPVREKISSGVQSKIGATRLAKKAIKKDIKQALKTSKSNRAGISNLLLVIIAILLPPLAVALVDGLRGPFWLDILLTILFYVPGLIYAIYRIFRNSNA